MKNTQKQTSDTRRTVVLEVVHRVALEITDPQLSAQDVAQQFAREINASTATANTWPQNFWADGGQVHIGEDPDTGAIAHIANRPDGTTITSCDAADIRGAIEEIDESGEYPMVEKRLDFTSRWTSHGKWNGLAFTA